MKEYSRDKVVALARSWLGKNEADGSFKEIVDIYNSFGKENLPRNILMQYHWAWCACTWSAIAIKLGYTDIMPIEMSCGELIDAAKKKGVWVEDDGYIPSPGDGILYDWDDTGKGDCYGWPDHVGVVEQVYKEAGYFVVIEGNYKDSVKRRTISINGRYIRGFIAPEYTGISSGTNPGFGDTPNSSLIVTIAHEVISGKWDKGAKRKELLEKAGYDYRTIQDKVNEILNGSAYEPVTIPNENAPFLNRVSATTYAQFKDESLSGTYKVVANPTLYCRNGAGTNKKALCKIPKGARVKNYGFFSVDGSAKWLLIQVVLDRTLYTGYCHEAYLRKI